MIKVYSIKNIVKASKKLLEESHKIKKKLIINDHLISSKNGGMTNFLNNAKLVTFMNTVMTLPTQTPTDPDRQFPTPFIK